MSASSAVLLAALVAVSPAAAASPPTRVLLLPLPAEASEAQQALAQALASRLGAERGVAVVPSERLVAPPPPPPDDARLRQEIAETLTRAQDAFRRVDVAEATRLLQALENARLAELGCPERIELAARIAFWMGVVHATKKDKAHAVERFTAVLSIDPQYPIDAGYFSPQTVALFEGVRRGLGAAPTGGLSLSAEPEAAQVFVDGRPAGQAPVTLTASEGDHFVCLRRVGWRDWAARLHLAAGKVDTQRIYLQRAAPEEVSRQLSAALHGQRPRLDEPAHLEALGAALAVDVVAELTPDGALRWREVRGAALEPREVRAAADAAPEHLALELAAGFSEALGVRPQAEPAPRAPPLERFSAEVAVAAGLPFGLGRGGFVGARLGVWFNPTASLGLGVRAGLHKPVMDIALFDAAAPRGALLATAQELLEAPLSLEARWHLVQEGRWRLSLQGGALVRVCTFASPVSAPGIGQSPPLVLLTAPKPFTLALVGPQLGLTAGRQLTARVAFLFGASYGLEVNLTRLAVAGNRPPAGAGGSPTPVTLTAMDSLRHVLALDVGLQWRFE